MNEKLTSVFERLRRRTIYSEREFKSPQKIVDEITKLRHLKDVDPQGLFSSGVRNIFFEDYRINPKLKQRNEIDPNKLAALIFTIHPPFDQNSYESLTKYEISLLQDSLLGKSTDFLEGKKESNFITPAYVVLRSLKEKDSYWLISTFKDVPAEKKKKLKKDIEKIIEKIASFFPEERKKTFLYRFGIDLFWLYEEIKSPNKQKKEETLSLTPVELDQPINIIKNRPVTVINRDELITDDKNIALHLSVKPEISPPFSPLEKLPISVSILNGKIFSPQDERSLKILDEVLESPNLGQTLQNKGNFSSAVAISIFSRLKKGDKPHISWLRGEDQNAVTSSFKDSSKKVFQKEEFENLKRRLKNSFDPSLEKPDFNLFNKRLLEILFENYRNHESFPINNLEDFIKVRGIAESFFALRNLFFFRLLYDQMRKVSFKLDRYKDFSFNSQPSNHLLFEIFSPFKKDLLFFWKNGHVKAKLSQISHEQIIDLGFFFSFEKFLSNTDKMSIDPLGRMSLRYAVTKGKKIKYQFPSGLSLSKTNSIGFQEIDIPYQIEPLIKDGRPLSINIFPIYKNDYLLSVPLIEQTVEKNEK